MFFAEDIIIYSENIRNTNKSDWNLQDNLVKWLNKTYDKVIDIYIYIPQ